jgi:hypothetical protein
LAEDAQRGTPGTLINLKLAAAAWPKPLLLAGSRTTGDPAPRWGAGAEGTKGHARNG